MNNLELESLRRLLFFSVPEAALLVAASDERIDGVQERSWRRWEEGAVPVPENIADHIMKLAKWRATAIEHMRAAVNDARLELPDDLVVVWYDSLDDWMTLNDREAVMWRPQCSVVAEAAAMGARLVKFDTARYAQWLGKRKDHESLRGAWAAEQP